MNTANKLQVGRWHLCLLMGGLAVWSWNYFGVFQPVPQRKPPAEAVRLEQAYAEADRLDPGWRFADLQARRIAVPARRNAALTVRAVYAALPEETESKESMLLEAALSGLHPREHLSESVADQVRAKMANRSAALKLGHELAEQSWGRYPSSDAIGSEPAFVGKMVAVLNLYKHKAILAVHDGDWGEALLNARIMLNVVRYLGDEPAQIYVLRLREATHWACAVLERTLAFGQPDPHLLLAIQQAMEEMETDPVLLLHWRSERAYLEAQREKMEERLAKSKKPLDMSLDQFRRGLPGYVHFLNEQVEIAKLPLETRIAQHRLRGELPEPESGHSLPKPFVFTAWRRTQLMIARKTYRSQTRLRCARVALAVERYRLDRGEWPETLDQLAPVYLNQAPLDPYTGRRLLYRKTADGVNVYSSGIDGVDDGGQFDPYNRDKPGTDVGFQLWNADQRPPPKGE